MRKTLVTGGAGFIGSHTVKKLLTDDQQVVVLDNFSSGSRHSLPPGHSQLEVIEGDVRDLATVRQAMQGVTHCMHLAAQSSVTKSMENPADSATENVVGFVNILNAARDSATKRIVYASSAAVYGNDGAETLREEVNLRPASPYGLEKQINELYVDLFKDLYNLSACGLRYFNVYGPGQGCDPQYADVISLFVEAITTEQSLVIYGDGMQTRDFVYIDDVVRVNIAALDSDYRGTLNVGSGVPVSLLELVEVLEKIVRHKSDRQFRPARTGEIKHSVADVSELFKALDIKARYSLEEGLSEMLGKSSQAKPSQEVEPSQMQVVA